MALYKKGNTKYIKKCIKSVPKSIKHCNQKSVEEAKINQNPSCFEKYSKYLTFCFLMLNDGSFFFDLIKKGNSK